MAAETAVPFASLDGFIDKRASPAAVVRGAVNTPEAIKEHRSGKEWDQEARTWRDRPTNAIVEDKGQFDDARRRHQRSNAEAGPSGASETASPHYYHVLGVEVRQHLACCRRAHGKWAGHVCGDAAACSHSDCPGMLVLLTTLPLRNRHSFMFDQCQTSLNQGQTDS